MRTLVTLFCYLFFNICLLSSQSLLGITVPSSVSTNGTINNGTRVNYSIPLLSYRLLERRSAMLYGQINTNNFGFRFKEKNKGRSKHRLLSTSSSIFCFFRLKEHFYNSSNGIQSTTDGIIMGYEIQYNLHYKNAYKPKGESKEKYTAWFADEVDPVFHTFVLGVKIRGILLALRYNPNDLFMKGYVDLSQNTFQESSPLMLGIEIDVDFLASKIFPNRRSTREQEGYFDF